ncbi:hypothetical protein F4775DRAFT_494991 [Biscogniauxia sp. FL1348]|nr:hypothetical protein F4775DRAFT_494991 [Biscogniauxia sp. FL1348]
MMSIISVLVNGLWFFLSANHRESLAGSMRSAFWKAWFHRSSGSDPSTAVEYSSSESTRVSDLESGTVDCCMVLRLCAARSRKHGSGLQQVYNWLRQGELGVLFSAVQPQSLGPERGVLRYIMTRKHKRYKHLSS